MEHIFFTAHGKQDKAEINQNLSVGIVLIDIIHRIYIINTAPQRSGPEKALRQSIPLSRSVSLMGGRRGAILSLLALTT